MVAHTPMQVCEDSDPVGSLAVTPSGHRVSRVTASRTGPASVASRDDHPRNFVTGPSVNFNLAKSVQHVKHHHFTKRNRSSSNSSSNNHPTTASATILPLPMLRLFTLVVLTGLLMTPLVGSLATLLFTATLAVVVLVARLPCYTIAHVFVDNSNIVVPLLARRLRIRYAGLREAVLRQSHVPLEWKWLVQRLKPRYRDMFMRRQPGSLYLTGSKRGCGDAPWVKAAEGAGFHVTQLTRVQRAPGWVGEEGVDDDLHKKMANTTLDDQSWWKSAARALGLLPRPVLVVVSGDGNGNHGNGGFPAQVRRALRSGMHVEVVSWRASLSAVYRTVQSEATSSSMNPPRMSIRYLDDCERVTRPARRRRTPRTGVRPLSNSTTEVSEGGESTASPSSIQAPSSLSVTPSPTPTPSTTSNCGGSGSDSHEEEQQVSTHGSDVGGSSTKVETVTEVADATEVEEKEDTVVPSPSNKSHPRVVHEEQHCTMVLHVCKGPSPDHHWGRGARAERTTTARTLPVTSTSSSSSSSSTTPTSTTELSAATTVPAGEDTKTAPSGSSSSTSRRYRPRAWVPRRSRPRQNSDESVDSMESAESGGSGSSVRSATPFGRAWRSASARSRSNSDKSSRSSSHSCHHSSAVAAPTTSDSDGTVVTDAWTRFAKPCRYGVRCTLRKCGYTHPLGWKRPPLLPGESPPRRLAPSVAANGPGPTTVSSRFRGRRGSGGSGEDMSLTTPTTSTTVPWRRNNEPASPSHTNHQRQHQRPHSRRSTQGHYAAALHTTPLWMRD